MKTQIDRNNQKWVRGAAVAQETLNLLVVGSNPTRRNQYCPLVELATHRTLNAKSLGSNPRGATNINVL